jgi:hypothetical protein
MLLNRELFQGGHVRRFTVSSDAPGWSVREEHDATVVRERHYVDWHRVELDARLFETRAQALERDGWVER